MEIKSVYLCSKCKAMFNSDAEMHKHLEGKNWDNLDCPKCGELLQSWRTVESIWRDLDNIAWLQKHGAMKSSFHVTDETSFEDALIEFVVDTFPEEEDEDDL